MRNHVVSTSKVTNLHKKMQNISFVHPIFLSIFLVTFGNEVTKTLHNLRQDGKDQKTEKITQIN